MSKFRVARSLRRDLIARVSYSVGNIIHNDRRIFEFLPEGSEDGWYSTEDQVLIESIKGLTEQIPYTPQGEEGLKQHGVEYHYTYCASCGGNKVRKIEYNLFEVIE